MAAGGFGNGGWSTVKQAGGKEVKRGVRGSGALEGAARKEANADDNECRRD